MHICSPRHISNAGVDQRQGSQCYVQYNQATYAADTSQGRAGLPAQHGKCRIPNPPMSATLGKSISVIWEEHTVGRPPDFPSVGFCYLDNAHKVLPFS